MVIAEVGVMVMVCMGIFILNFNKYIKIPNNYLLNGLLMRFVALGKNFSYWDF